jgi:hypothetical protein
VDELVSGADFAAARRIGDSSQSTGRFPILLRKNGYRKRKALKKTTMGPRNPNRNAQFKKITRLKKRYLKAGLPQGQRALIGNPGKL